MSGPPSPAFSEISITFCCSEEGSDGNADSDYCSPHLKRAKRVELTQNSTRVEESLKKNLLNHKFLREFEGIESQLSTNTVSNRNFCGEFGHNSNHSLPTLDLRGPASDLKQFGRRLSFESIRREAGHEHFERRWSCDEDVLRHRADPEPTTTARRNRVLSSYCHHLKEDQQLVGSDRGSCKTDPTVSTALSAAAEDPEGASDVSCEDTVKVKFGLSEVTYESGEDAVRGILAPVTLETVMGSDHCENWSTTNSLQEDDAPQNGLKSTETAGSPRTPGHCGDTQTWNSSIEKEYKNELEFSTLVTLAYVRVRDLTNTINQASSYLESIDEKDSKDAEETKELRSEIQAMFKERASLSLEHSKWRSEFSEVYLQRKKVLSNLKSQAALAEQSYFNLRKELEDLQNEPVVTKPKRTWFSRLCAFIK